jgi:hypothetical protein
MSLGPTDPQEKLTQPGEICEALGLTKLVHREPKRSNGPFEKIIDAMWEPIRASRYSSFLSIPKLFDEYRCKIKKSANQYTSGVKTMITSTSSTTAHRNTPNGKFRIDKIFAIPECYGLCCN